MQRQTSAVLPVEELVHYPKGVPSCPHSLVRRNGKSGSLDFQRSQGYVAGLKEDVYRRFSLAYKGLLETLSMGSSMPKTEEVIAIW
jgi:hypothetical protein